MLSPDEERRLRELLGGVLHVDTLRIGTGRQGPIRIEFAYGRGTISRSNSLTRLPALEFDAATDEQPRLGVTHDGSTAASPLVSADGTVPITATQEFNGSPPFTVTSLQSVANLNAERLSDFPGGHYQDRGNHTGTSDESLDAKRYTLLMS